jgi:hypothetical protein
MVEVPEAVTRVVARLTVHGSLAIPGRHSHTVVDCAVAGGADRGTADRRAVVWGTVVHEAARHTSTNGPAMVINLDRTAI